MSQIKITLPDGSVKELPVNSTGLQLAEDIGPGLARNAIAIEVGGETLDLATPLVGDCEVAILTNNNSEASLKVIRHSAAHVLAEAICELWPGTKLAYGPAVDDGFFYDMDTPESISQDDFPKIEAKMKEIIKAKRDFTRINYSLQDGLQRTDNDKYKTDNAERAIERGSDTLSFYTTGIPGENWEDLCAGPHVPHTGLLKHFKVMAVAGAYWHGDQESDQLTRVYGTAFADKKALKDHLHRIEEAKKRDHRRLAKELDYFHLDENSPGMVFWHPKGTTIYNTLTDYIRNKISSKGYQEVRTPEIVEKTLWEKSGHWDKYSDMMFVTESEKRTFAVKPMNCPCHIEIFKQGLKSWRDLPIRLAEFGKCHRNEMAGSMHGIMRVRGFVQDDAHIFCTEGQIADEVADFCHLVKEIYADFGFSDILVKFSTRPEKRVGTDESWDIVEKALAEATKKAGLETVLNEGEGAFYGPKLEFVLKDCLGRDWQCGTIQVDPNLPERLGATFVDADGEKKNPIMLHRAILGSLERFIGILIEEFAGDFPFWLNPTQCKVIPVGEKYMDYAKEVNDQLQALGFRSEVDERNEKLGKKIRDGETTKIPYMIIVGEKEQEEGTVNVRKRKAKDQIVMPLTELVSVFNEENAKLCRKVKEVPEVESEEDEVTAN